MVFARTKAHSTWMGLWWEMKTNITLERIDLDGERLNRPTVWGRKEKRPTTKPLTYWPIDALEFHGQTSCIGCNSGTGQRKHCSLPILFDECVCVCECRIVVSNNISNLVFFWIGSVGTSEPHRMKFEQKHFLLAHFPRSRISREMATHSHTSTHKHTQAHTEQKPPFEWHINYSKWQWLLLDNDANGTTIPKPWDISALGK